MFLNFLLALTRTFLLAGLALKTQGSLVNGFTPFRAGLAAFVLSFMLRTPPKLNLPFFFNSAAASSTYVVTTAFTCFGLSSVASAILLAAWDAVSPSAPVAFLAVAAFMAFMAVAAFLTFMAVASFMAFIAGAIVLAKIPRNK